MILANVPRSSYIEMSLLSLIGEHELAIREAYSHLLTGPQVTLIGSMTSRSNELKKKGKEKKKQGMKGF